MAEIVVYERKNEQVPYLDWFDALDNSVRPRVEKYVLRMEDDNFGDSKAVGDGVMELKLDFGPGYRVYYGLGDGGVVVVLLAGGTKRRQSRDIKFAQELWSEYLNRKQ